MKLIPTLSLRRSLAALLAVTAFAWAGAAQAHCDTLDGPVVGQARAALESGKVDLVLGWVQPADEAEVRHAFEQAVAVRRAGGAARELADRHFFETLVRVHRAGEGAPYTGLKPAGHIEPEIAAADTALRTGQLGPVAKTIAQQTEHGLHERFEAARAAKPRDPADVAASRKHVAAYVEYVHYVEGLSRAAAGGAVHEAADAPAATGHAH